MSQAYGDGFARVYDQMWAGFARRVAPLIAEYYESTPLARENRRLLDLCCGTGQLSVYFLGRGYQVVGLDLSPAMLHFARQNSLPYQVAGLARFVQGDAALFELEERFGLVVSTYDALNHLPDAAALQSCFRSVFQVLEADGVFIFDLNTALGLQRWNGVMVNADEEVFLLQRAMFDDLTVKAWNKITGFVREADGRYARFDETAYNTVFAVQDVLDWLSEAGFVSAYPAHEHDLSTALSSPEQEGRVFFVARHP